MFRLRPSFVNSRIREFHRSDAICCDSTLGFGSASEPTGRDMRAYWIALSAVMLAACSQEAPVPAEPTAEDAVGVPVQMAVEDAAQPSVAPDATEMPIQRVDSLMISRLNDRDESVLILAAGSVNSDGWTDVHLAPVASEDDETTRSFQFLATSPEASPTNPNPQRVEARLELPDLPPEVEMVRVIAETNELTAFVGN